MVKRLLIFLIRIYQKWLSPLLGQRCRFYPSCSSYAKESLETHGALKGGWLTLRRLVKCGPWHPGGLDEVPGQGADSGER
ncbi:MAG: membrane protein insertion efficiency factor YidD [Simkaniaceae bacterium]|nr:membrane protein insertion efficiency factor YidD [Simkaniaceae bacterium]